LAMRYNIIYRSMKFHKFYRINFRQSNAMIRILDEDSTKATLPIQRKLMEWFTTTNASVFILDSWLIDGRRFISVYFIFIYGILLIYDNDDDLVILLFFHLTCYRFHCTDIRTWSYPALLSALHIVLRSSFDTW